MDESLYVFVEIGAGFAAIITFMFTFLTMFRRWVLKRIYRDIEQHLATRDGPTDGYAGRARDEAERARYAARQARHAARQARHAADEARDATNQARQAVLAAQDRTRAVAGRRHDDTRSGSQPENRQGPQG